MTATLAERAGALRRLHHDPELLVLVNAWDAASARAVAAAPGCAAIATASWSIAAARGVADGEVLSRAEMLAAVATVAGAVALPVTADLEAGYGDDAAAVGETVAAAIAAGAVGCNLEDGSGDGLRPAAEHAARVAAARAAGDAAGVPVVINARTDVFLNAVGEPGERVGVALERGRAYLAAGADCVFVPGASDPRQLAALVGGMGGPVSVLAGPDSPSLAELQALGVARASLGPGSLGVAMAALQALAASLLAHGPLPAELDFEV
jgi:2-methylisocitrate lyase-like PEP mutase family enzyme